MTFLPVTQCGPIKPRKYPPDVRGTCNIDFGHRLKERTECRVKPRGSVFEGGGEDTEEEQRKLKQFLSSWAFEKWTNRRIKKKSAWQHVQQGLAAYEECVEERREKLRGLILGEESKLTREVIDQAQHGDDSRMEEIREKTESWRKQQEEKRLALVAAKRMQQYLGECAVVRDEWTKRRTIEAKRGNLAQIAEKEARLEAEKELEALWHELLLREVEAKRQRESVESEKRARADRETVSVLAKQIAGKLALEETQRRIRVEEKGYLERLWENLRQEELKNLEEERRNRERLKRDLEEQILTTKRYLTERAREEAAMDRMLKELAEEEIAREKSKIKETSAALRRELLSHLQYLEDIRREEARRNLEVDAIIEQSNKDAATRRSLAIRKFKESRQRALDEVMCGREEQIKRKREQAQKELEARRTEKELLEKRLELDAELSKRQQREAKDRARRYGQELMEQHKSAEEMRRLEAERARQSDETRNEEYQKLTRELLQASDNVIPHPFKILLKECAARFAAEKEGACYCPPPLQQE